MFDIEGVPLQRESGLERFHCPCITVMSTDTNLCMCKNNISNLEDTVAKNPFQLDMCTTLRKQCYGVFFQKCNTMFKCSLKILFHKLKRIQSKNIQICLVFKVPIIVAHYCSSLLQPIIVALYCSPLLQPIIVAQYHLVYLRYDLKQQSRKILFLS